MCKLTFIERDGPLYIQLKESGIIAFIIIIVCLFSLKVSVELKAFRLLWTFAHHRFRLFLFTLFVLLFIITFNLVDSLNVNCYSVPINVLARTMYVTNWTISDNWMQMKEDLHLN